VHAEDSALGAAGRQRPRVRDDLLFPLRACIADNRKAYPLKLLIIIYHRKIV
jgi:hypothetical protein